MRGVIDFSTLALLIVGGLGLGALGFFGYDATTELGPYVRVVYLAMGISAVWQLARQKFY
jgi:uncharacterized membrane protein YuzA (DUF378 family)